MVKFITSDETNVPAPNNFKVKIMVCVKEYCIELYKQNILIYNFIQVLGNYVLQTSLYTMFLFGHVCDIFMYRYGHVGDILI